MKRLLILFALLFATGVARAQMPPAPVLMLVNGEDIYGYYPSGLARLTFSGYTDRPVLSPDGSRMAYKVIADIGIQALRTTGGLVSELPSDIEIRNIASGAVARIATQPADATFNAGEAARAIVRSSPAWSPDSRMLAWTEDVAPDAVRRLVVFSPDSGETRVLASGLPLQAGFQQTLPVRWGAGGIAVHSVSATAGEDAAASPTLDTIFFYSPEGALLSTANPQPAEGEFVYDFQWIDVNGAALLGIIYSTGRWDVIDPASGTIAPLEGTPELYSLTAPDGLAVVFGVTTLPDSGSVFTWRVGETPLPFTGPIEWIGIAPTGDAVAYADQGIGYLWNADGAQEIFGTNDFNFRVSDIVWGPVGWRVSDGG